MGLGLANLTGSLAELLPDNHVDGPYGISWDSNNPTTVLSFSFGNMLIHSVLPIPLSGVFWIAAIVLYGPVVGFIFAMVTSAIGCSISFAIARSFKPYFLECLGGEHAKVWRSMDGALARDGWKIPLLIRSTPASPAVLTNFMLSLTSIDFWTYTWTMVVGMIPSGFPYAYAAVVGQQVLHEFPPTDGPLLVMSIFGLVVTFLTVYKVGAVASEALREAGIPDLETYESPRSPDGATWVRPLSSPAPPPPNSRYKDTPFKGKHLLL